MATIDSVPYSPLFNSIQSDVTFEIYFQLGFHREAVYFVQENLNLNELLEKACSIVENQFSQRLLGLQLMDSINLFVHDSQSENILKLLKNSDKLLLKQKDVIEIVLSCDLTSYFSAKFCDLNNQVRQHDLDIHSFHAPAFCDFCGEMLWGIVRQGLRCKGCGQNYHKRCAYKIPNDCSLTRKRKSCGSSTNGMLSVQESRAPVYNSRYFSRPIWMDALPKIKVPHNFQVHTFKTPTRCGVCRRVLLGVYKQGLQCKDCKLNCHKKCHEEIRNGCPGEEDASLSDYDDGDVAEESEPMETPTTNGDCTNENSQNIPLMRVFQSIKQKKTVSNTLLKDGWLFHFSSIDAMQQRRRHFWRLDTKSITLFRRDTGSNFFKEIPLSDILDVVMESPVDPGIPHYSFRIQTKAMELFVSDESGTVSGNILLWHAAILKALNPVEAGEGERDYKHVIRPRDYDVL